MKSIKELEEHIEELENKSWYRCHVETTKEEWIKAIAKLETLKEVLELINELSLKCPIQEDKECWCKPLEELKARIEGEEK